MKDDNKDEGPGFCPFCSITGFRICDHFSGYIRGSSVATDGVNRYGKRVPVLRPTLADEDAVNTGVSVRAYRNTRGL